jgi:hypothetical protein
VHRGPVAAEGDGGADTDDREADGSGIVSSTGTTPAATHPSWNRVSKRANVRPRSALGASRWTMLSKPSRPVAAAKLTAIARTTPGSRPAEERRADAGDRRDDERGEHHVLLGDAGPHRGPIELAAIEASDDITTASANQNMPASLDRSQKARWNSMKPTHARKAAIAAAADRIALDASSRRSATPAGAGTARSRGSCRAAASAKANITAPYSSVAGVPMVTWSSSAGSTATKPVTPAITPSLALASTRSRSVRTTDGTSADFDTR